MSSRSFHWNLREGEAPAEPRLAERLALPTRTVTWNARLARLFKNPEILTFRFVADTVRRDRDRRQFNFLFKRQSDDAAHRQRQLSQRQAVDLRSEEHTSEL